MTLTYNEMEMITLDMLLGSKLRVTGPDADEFVKAFQADIDLAKENNWNIELPFDIEEFSDPDGKKSRKIVITKGGPGSGHHGHAGRPGKVGGSAPTRGSERMIGAYHASAAGSAHSYTLDKADPDPRDNPKDIIEGRRMSWHNAMSIVNNVARQQSDFSEQPDEPVKEMYADWLTYHDVMVGNKLRLIVVPENNAEWENEYDRTFDDKDSTFSVGFFNKDYDQITIKPRSAEVMADVFHHEMGHIAYKHSKTRNIWIGKYRGDGDFDRFTSYSTKNASEGFAESYMAYTANIGPVKKYLVELETMDIVQEVIDGVR